MTARRVVRTWGGLLATLLLLMAATVCLRAQIKDLPPKPDRYVTDQAGVLDAGSLETINSQLEQFERDTSNQFVVAIYPKLPDDAEIAQYCTYAAESWKIGQPDKHNGVVLFIFTQSHQMYFAVARGLEGALTDALCKNVVTYVITPHFKQGDYPGGIQAGVDAIIAASKGEYKGNGATDADSSNTGSSHGLPVWAIILLIIVVFIIMRARGGGGGMGPMIFTGGGWGGGGFGGGGFSGGGGGGGGGFSSGGGGGFAGGGAGGSW